MSDNTKLKTAARARQARTGESYSTARMHVLASLSSGASNTPPAASSPPPSAPTVPEVPPRAEPPGPRRPRVFMSHATADKPEVEWIANTLRGLRPELDFWIDSWSMVPGDSLIAKINDGLSSSDRLVVFLTPSSVASRWVAKELDAGLVLEVAQQHGFKGDNFVIPVVLKALPANYSFPPLMAPKLRCDFTTATSFEAACAELLRGILGTPAGPSDTRLQNLGIRWEHFAPPGRPDRFGMRVTFSARLTPEKVGYRIDFGQPYAKLDTYWGSPRNARAEMDVHVNEDAAGGVYWISIDQPRITPEKPYVVEVLSERPWPTKAPVIQLWRP